MTLGRTRMAHRMCGHLYLLQNMATIRLHLDETSATNGALRVIPGRHRNGRIDTDALRDLDKDAAVTCECSPEMPFSCRH